MKFLRMWKRRREKKYTILYKRGPSTLAAIFAGMALALWALFAIFSSYPVGLYMYYTVAPKTTELLGKALEESSRAMSVEAKNQPVVQTPITLPPIAEVNKDISLPEGHYLSIPKIGVDAIIWEGEGDGVEKALRKGVWRASDFAVPGQEFPDANAFRPIILAAHRFGYLEWSQDFRLKNSFYMLPDLKPGDQVEMVWDQRRYKYEIAKVEEGTEIDDYSSDLIMYTCKFLVSPVRIFVYAKLID